MAYQLKDYYFHKAKKENFAARSVFKLEEIQKRFRIFKKSASILDLGAAPGSWSQYASKQIGQGGQILGIDLQKIPLSLGNARWIEGDLNLLSSQSSFQKEAHLTYPELRIPFDLVLSDMAPRTTGIKITDHARSVELAELALCFAERYLKTQGHFVCKMFDGEGFSDFRSLLKKNFAQLEILRPQSTRKESKEIFFIGLKKLP